MDSFDVKIEKANAILRYRRLQKITTLFRFLELCVFLIVISNLSIQFPVAFKISGDYFRGLSLAVFSPRFVFIVGNLIVMTLFLKSGQLSSQSDTESKSRADNLYDEYALEKTQKVFHAEEVEKQMNLVRVDERPKAQPEVLKMQRSQSEKLTMEYYEDSRRKLRRSVTDRGLRSKPAEDDMSSEEFRQAVEAFIARQQRYLREEEFSAVVSSSAE